MPAGNFKVYFYNSGLNYVSEWYNDKSSFDEADQVTVTAGSTTPNINAQLATGGGISGRVTNTSAAGIQNIRVRVYDLDYNFWGSIYTDASGNYTVMGLPTGNYKVYFYNNGLNYVSEWYSDKSSFDAADQVTVTAGSTTPNINAELATGGGISGRVTNTSAAGIQNIRVRIYDLDYNYLGLFLYRCQRQLCGFRACLPVTVRSSFIIMTRITFQNGTTTKAVLMKPIR